MSVNGIICNTVVKILQSWNDVKQYFMKQISSAVMHFFVSEKYLTCHKGKMCKKCNSPINGGFIKLNP